MAVNVRARGRRFELRVRHKLLPRAFYATFDVEAEAQKYGDQLQAMLARGIVPQELLAGEPKSGSDPLVYEIVKAYLASAPGLTESDTALLGVLVGDKPLVGLRVSGLTYRCVETYVAWLKSAEMHLAPSSIRKRIGALGRVVDWHLRRLPAEGAPANPLRLLPRGYSTYSANDTEGGAPRRDVQRDRRLSAEEAERIARVLAGEKREDRERVFTDDAAFGLLYQVLVETGLRLFEAFRLRADSIDLDKRVMRVEGSKGHRGWIKPRVVPITPALYGPLRARCAGRVGLLFPYWDGTPGGGVRTRPTGCRNGLPGSSITPGCRIFRRTTCAMRRPAGGSSGGGQMARGCFRTWRSARSWAGPIRKWRCAMQRCAARIWRQRCGSSATRSVSRLAREQPPTVRGLARAGGVNRQGVSLNLS